METCTQINIVPPPDSGQTQVPYCLHRGATGPNECRALSSDLVPNWVGSPNSGRCSLGPASKEQPILNYAMWCTNITDATFIWVSEIFSDTAECNDLTSNLAPSFHTIPGVCRFLRGEQYCNERSDLQRATILFDLYWCSNSR